MPNKPRGVPRVEDRRVRNGIFWVLPSEAPWRELPERCDPRTTCYTRFARWRKPGVWDRRMDAISATHDGAPQMIDSTSVRAVRFTTITPGSGHPSAVHHFGGTGSWNVPYLIYLWQTGE